MCMFSSVFLSNYSALVFIVSLNFVFKVSFVYEKSRDMMYSLGVYESVSVHVYACNMLIVNIAAIY